MIIPVLMYHEIAENNVSRNRYVVTKETFILQMEYLRKQGYTAVTINELAKGLSGDIKPVMVTFDDGFDTDYIVALPILQKYGLKSIHFITTDYIGNKGYMTWVQIQGLKEKGFSIQSHTKSHNLLTRLSEEEIRQELLSSKDIIVRETGENPLALSLPRGEKPKEIKALLEECGYRYFFTSKPGINFVSEGDEIVEFGRIPIFNNIDIEYFQEIVSGGKYFYYRQLIKFMIKQFLKQVIPYKIYYKLWEMFNKKEKEDL